MCTVYACNSGLSPKGEVGEWGEGGGLLQIVSFYLSYNFSWSTLDYAIYKKILHTYEYFERY